MPRSTQSALYLPALHGVPYCALPYHTVRHRTLLIMGPIQEKVKCDSRPALSSGQRTEAPTRGSVMAPDASGYGAMGECMGRRGVSRKVNAGGNRSDPRVGACVPGERLWGTGALLAHFPTSACESRTGGQDRGRYHPTYQVSLLLHRQQAAGLALPCHMYDHR